MIPGERLLWFGLCLNAALVVALRLSPPIFGIGMLNLFDVAWMFRGALPTSFFFSISSFNCALRSLAVSADALRRDLVSAISLSSLRWMVFCSVRCACRPRLRLMRAFSLLLIFRGMQVFEAATIDSATRVSKTQALSCFEWFPSQHPSRVHVCSEKTHFSTASRGVNWMLVFLFVATCAVSTRFE